MNWKAIWTKIRTNPILVAFWTAFVGALGEQFLRLANTGSFDWSGKNIVEMLGAASTTAIIALIHLYTQSSPPAPLNLSSKIPPAAMLALLAVFLALPMMGCATASTSPPTAPGYANQADQQMGQTLAGARSFYASISTAKDLTAAETTALNDLGKAINVAEAAYKAFHAGQGTQAAAQTAVDQVTAKQSAVEALGVKP